MLHTNVQHSFSLSLYIHAYIHAYVCVRPEYPHLFVLCCKVSNLCIMMCICSKKSCVYARTSGKVVILSLDQASFQGLVSR
ncbi:hypothetical protein L6452_18691 [Arctium lappa]|uniref:Uncharacterized protein n=1 Tax=Arctium lappa TaxID=4217 RepID=A0ACB9C6Z4_ARCLA|nr:hypothetical protein L6452_18691 [Arctium lappa]